LLIVIIFAPLSFYLYNFNFYNRLYEKNGVYDVLDRNDVADLTKNVYDFFKYKRDFEPFKLKNGTEYFNSNEISHLDDVRILLRNIFIVFCVCLFLFLASIIALIDRNHAVFFKNISVIAVISSSVMLFILIMLYFFGNNFISLFENFHYIFFPQGNWAFPEGSLIITIFPFGFFYDFFFRLLLSSLLISIILLFAGVAGIILSNRKIRKKTLKTIEVK